MLTRPILFGLVAGLICALLSRLDWTLPVDRMVYDLSVRAMDLDVPPDVMLIAIDDKSLVEIGRWPWPRERHTELLRHLAEAGPRALAMDLVFADRDTEYPEVDLLLAQALGQLSNTILPVYVGQLGRGGLLHEVLPIPPLRDSAGALGHVHVEVDSDGVARGVFLREGLGEARWRHLAVELADAVGRAPARLPGGVAGQLAPEESAIVRNHFNLIPMIGPANSVPTVSYSDVVRGRIPGQLLQDKILFLGVTAVGLGDNVATPMGRMSGVELNINIYNALSRGKLLWELPHGLATALGFALTFLVSVGVTRLATARQVLYLLAVLPALVALSALLFQFARLWFSPVPIVIAVLLAYALWGWVRLYALLGLIRDQLQSIRGVPGLSNPDAGGGGRIADEDIARLRGVFQQARDSRALIDGAIDDLTTGVLIGDLEGEVLFHNREALSLLQPAAPGARIQDFLSAVSCQQGLDTVELFLRLVSEREPFEVEGHTGESGRDVLLRGRVIELSEPLAIVAITDTTPVKASERSRAEALNFLSHDLRAPLTSALALIESAREEGSGRQPRDDLLERIEGYVRTNLSYAENFVQLSRLQHIDEAEPELCEAQAIVDDAIAQLIHGARQKQVTLRVEGTDRDIWLRCHRTQMVRACMNLIDNAVKYSPPGEDVRVALRLEGEDVIFEITDRGPGVEASQAEEIFQAFRQGHNARGGVGLGLRFVAAVAGAHGGSVAVASRIGGGSCFRLSVPVNGL